MKQVLSCCCNKEVVKATKQEFPLGGTFYQTLITEVCTGCRHEADYELVSLCDHCATPDENLIPTVYGDWCKGCLEQSIDELIVREVSA